MIKKKGKFLTFLFSLIPGAGQMYLGFMKLGVSLMGLFAAIFIVSNFINMSVLFFLLPIVWCYAFFDAINKNSLSDEEFYALEDHYCISYETIDSIKKLMYGKERQVIAVVLILIGVDILWENFFWLLGRLLPGWFSWRLYDMIYRLPQVLIGCIVLYVGFLLIKKRKQELLEHREERE